MSTFKTLPCTDFPGIVQMSCVKEVYARAPATSIHYLTLDGLENYQAAHRKSYHFNNKLLLFNRSLLQLHHDKSRQLE